MRFDRPPDEQGNGPVLLATGVLRDVERNSQPASCRQPFGRAGQLSEHDWAGLARGQGSQLALDAGGYISLVAEKSDGPGADVLRRMLQQHGRERFVESTAGCNPP